MTDDKGRIRVLIVEDQPLFRDLLRRALSAEERIEVVGAAGDGDTAVRMARELNPDVILTDVELPGQLNGIQAALEVRKSSAQTGVVILSAHKDKQYVTSVPVAQAAGWSYLLKQSVADVSALERAIEGSASGLMVLDPEVVAGLRPREGTGLARLTPRQLQVLELIAQGYSNGTIAEKLSLGEKSVENYINTIYQELNLSGEGSTHPRVKATLAFLEETRNR